MSVQEGIAVWCAAFLAIIAVVGCWSSGAFPVGKWKINKEHGQCDEYFHSPLYEGKPNVCRFCYTVQVRKLTGK